MAVGDVYRMSVEGTINDVDTFVNVLHYRQTIDIPGGDAVENLMDAWLEDAMPYYQDLMYEGFRFNKLTVRQVIGGSAVGERALSIFGTRTGTTGHLLPFQSAAIISWRTGLAGRSFRGRTFLFPALEEDQNGTMVSAAYLLLMQDIADNWLEVTDSVAGDTYELVIYSEVLNLATTVTTGLTRGTLGTVRRRRPGVGS